jgi:hypothetical protein
LNVCSYVVLGAAWIVYFVCVYFLSVSNRGKVQHAPSFIPAWKFLNRWSEKMVANVPNFKLSTKNSFSSALAWFIWWQKNLLYILIIYLESLWLYIVIVCDYNWQILSIFWKMVALKIKIFPPCMVLKFVSWILRTSIRKTHDWCHTLWFYYFWPKKINLAIYLRGLRV